MSGFQITITDAGRAALINAQNTGTVAFVLSQIGVSTQTIAGGLAGLTALPNERKRLATMAGDVVADDTLHVTIRDESADAYALRSFGLYASTGVLFAVYSQADPILEKSAAAMLLLAVDARLVALGTANVEFGPVGFTLPPASETVAGVVEIATDAEVDAGVDPWRVITVRTLKRALGALTDFALKGHKHDAADVETGTFHANRIPELPMSRITNLIASLGEKASALHSHTMAQVSGLVAALAEKAPLTSPTFSGIVEAPQFLLNAAASMARRIVIRTAGATRWTLGATGSGEAGGNAGSDFTIDRYTDGGAYIGAALAISRATGQATLSTRPLFGSATPWDSVNFDPATKADTATALVMRGSLGGVNLDTVLTPGAYRQATAANAQLALNYPINNDGGSLVVVNPSTDTGYQTYHSRTTSRMWTRPFLAGSFYPWAEHWTSDNLPDPARVGTFNTFTTYQAIETSNALPLRLSSSAASGTQIQLNNSNGGAVSRYIGITADGELVFGASLTATNNRLVYHSGNLNPASFAVANHTHDGLIVRQTYAPGTDLNTLTSSGIIGVHANPAANLNFPVIATGALEVFASAATRVYQRYTTSSATAPDIYERTLVGSAWSPWRKVVMDDLASTYGARGLIEMATDAEAIAGTDQERAINPYILKRRIDARAASNAETLAGSLTDKFVTPAALWSFAKSIGPSGRHQIPGTDLIFQWGFSNGSHPEGTVHATLPAAFGGGCLFACATPRNAAQAYGMDFVMQIVGRYLDRIVFYANRANSSSGNMSGYEWMAIGLAIGNPDPVYSAGGGAFPPGGGGGPEIIP